MGRRGADLHLVHGGAQDLLRHESAGGAGGLWELLALIHPGDRDRVRQAFEQAEKQGTDFEGSFRLLRPQSGAVVIRYSGTSRRTPAGAGSLVFGSLHGSAEGTPVEDALLEQKSLLSSIIESTQDAVFIKDLEGRYLLANSADARELGLPLSQVLGATDYELFPREIAEETRRADREVIASGAPIAYEQTFRRPERKTLIYQINKYPRRDRNGNVIGVIGIARDITERKRAEEAARESEERFRQIAENSGQVFWLTDWEKRELLYVSPSYERVFGLSCQSAYQNRRSWLEALHPEDRARIDRVFAEKGEQGETTEEEYRIVDPDGGVRWIRDRSIPVRNAAGKVYRWVGVAEDVTRRKRAEEALEAQRQRLYSVLDRVPGFVYLLARDYGIRFANRFFRDHFGDPEAGACYCVFRDRNEPCKSCRSMVVFDTGKPQVWEWDDAPPGAHLSGVRLPLHRHRRHQPSPGNRHRYHRTKMGGVGAARALAPRRVSCPLLAGPAGRSGGSSGART